MNSKIKEAFERMNPFKRDRDGDFIVPKLPILPKDDYESIVIPNLIRCGAIPKSALEVGHIYEGSCRNSSTATWDGEKFVYTRTKFGASFEERINHFEDDDKSDLFIPIKLLK